MLSIERDDDLSPDALALIEGSEKELAALYPPEVRYAFSPDELREAGVRFVVGRAGGRPVACGGVAILDGYGELKRVFVDPAHRGAGHAGSIVAALEDVARAAGVDLMRLETGLASPEAIGLYRRLGYRERGPFGTYVDNGSSVYMEKRL